jgi:DNA polymerase-1
MTPERVFLVDGTALVYRAHFAFLGNPMMTRGEPMAAVFGFANALVHLLQQERPAFLGVAFDLPGPTFRHERYPDYKAHRPPMPEELVAQMPKARRLAGAVGARVIEREGVEADDLIGTMAKQARAAGHETVIVSADKDFMQLVGPGIRQWIPPARGGPGEWIDAAAVRIRWGVGPEGMIDLFALMGDASDNVPGVKGIGPKTAADLLERFGSLDGVYVHLGALGKKAVRTNLERDRDNAYLSRDLVTIRTDLDPPCSIEELRISVVPLVPVDFLALLDEFEFRQLRRRLGQIAGTTPIPAGASAEGLPGPENDGLQAFPGPAARVLRPQEVLSGAFPGAAAAASGRENPELAWPDAGAAGVHPNAAVDPDTGGGQVAAVTTGDAWSGNYRVIASPEDLDRILSRWRHAARPLVLDTETMGLNARRDAIVGLGLGWEPGAAYYLPLGHTEGANLPLSWVAERLAPVLADPGVTLIGHNLKFDLHVLGALGLESRCLLRDTLLAAYLDDPDERHNLDALSLRFLGHSKIPLTELIGTGKSRGTMDRVPVIKAAAYCGEDVDATLRLHAVLEPRLRAAGLHRLWTELECPLVRTLLRMEQVGVRVDTPLLGALSVGMEADLHRLEQEIQTAAGEAFNVNSPRQLETLLFDRLGLPPRRKTKTGRSTDQEVLEELASLHPVPRLILEYRELAKLKSTYLDAMPARVDARTGRIHASFNQAVAATGRLSSSDPNLQNIPVRTERGRGLRRAFAAPPGWVLVSADYSQVELRILAHLSHDPGLLDAFSRGIDVHTATAARIFGVRPDQVGPSMRARAKTINFGVIYGMGATRLARELSISFAEARTFIDTYFVNMPGVRSFQEETMARARREGMVRTITGRRRFLRGIAGGDARVRAQAERMAINTPIQGSAADLIKQAMLDVERRLAERGLRARMILQVHDELLLEAPEGEAPAVAELLREAMEGADRQLLRGMVGAGPLPHHAESTGGAASPQEVGPAGESSRRSRPRREPEPGLFSSLPAADDATTPDRLAVPLRVELGCGSNWDEAHA